MQIESINIDLSAEHNTLLTENTIEMHHLEDDQLKFDLNEATKQIIAKTFNLKETDLNLIDNTNSDLFFINFNSFNYYYEGLTR